MPDTQEPPLFFEGGNEEHIRKVALITRELLDGKSNNTVSSITLDPNSTVTIVDRERVSSETIVNLTPKSENAALAISSGSLWVETTKGRLTIHHDSSSATDRTFGAVFVG